MQNLFISSDQLFRLRCLFFLVTVECIILNQYLSITIQNVHPNYVYLTNWGLIMTSTYLGLAILNQNYHLQKYDYFELIIENLFKVTINIQFLIVLFFWIFLSPILVHQYQKSKLLAFLSVQTHFLMVVFLWIDNIFNLVRIKEKDYLYSFIFGTIYIIFNFIIVKSSGHYIYP